MIALLRRDLAIATRSGGAAMLGVLFFLAVVAVIPFGIGPDLNLLARIGPAILWIGALLASLLGLDRLFQADREDGSLDMLAMQDWFSLVLTVYTAGDLSALYRSGKRLNSSANRSLSRSSGWGGSTRLPLAIT